MENRGKQGEELGELWEKIWGNLKTYRKNMGNNWETSWKIMGNSLELLYENVGLNAKINHQPWLLRLMVQT